jgi:hypothetical protein
MKTMKTSDSPQSVVDPVITEVRRHKHEIAAAFGFDVMALGRSLQLREAGDPRFKKPEAGQGAAAGDAEGLDTE